MQPEIKSIGMEVKAIASEDTDGEFEAILSTSQVDRDGETIQPGAFNPVPKSIPIFYAHDWQNGALPIGSGEPYYDGDVLKIRGRYAPTEKAQEVRALVTGGFVTSMSAGFLTKSRKGKSISAGDLLEGSMTPLPVNSGALVLASKSFADSINAAMMTRREITDLEDLDLKAGARNNAGDKKRIQAMHNLSAELGATCNTDSGAGNVTITGAKAIGDEGVSIATLAQGVDAALDEAVALFGDADLTTLPENVAQAIGLVMAAQSTVDDLLDAMGVDDPDDPDGDDSATKSLPTVAAPADAADTKSVASTAAVTVDEEAALLALKAEALALVAHTAAL